VRHSKLDAPHIKEKVVKELAVGKSQKSIAKEVGLNQSSVCRFANREDISKRIEQEKHRLIEAVPDAVDNIKGLVREMKNLPKSDIKGRELSYKASKDVLKAVGLLPSPINQTLINIQGNKPILSDNIMKILEMTDEFSDFELPTDIST
jgi:predicted transcriptional regulator